MNSPTETEIARGMLHRYATPKIALEMALHHQFNHKADSAKHKYWANVQKEMQRILREEKS